MKIFKLDVFSVSKNGFIFKILNQFFRNINNPINAVRHFFAYIFGKKLNPSVVCFVVDFSFSEYEKVFYKM